MNISENRVHFSNQMNENLMNYENFLNLLNIEKSQIGINRFVLSILLRSF